MNKALNLKNWNRGGNHYVLNATSSNRWVGFQETVIEKLKTKFGDDFFLVIQTNRNKEDDYFNIPFRKLKHLFTEEHKTTGKFPNRWTATIINDQFLMHSNSQLAVDIKENYGNQHIAQDSDVLKQIEDDLKNYEIENEYFEGERKYRLSSFYERNPKLRAAVIKAHGFVCKACGFDFEKKYGTHGIGFIEVHHLKPVCELKASTKVCPVNDMTVLCSNCHRILHRKKNEILSVDDLKCLISEK